MEFMIWSFSYSTVMRSLRFKASLQQLENKERKMSSEIYWVKLWFVTGLSCERLDMPVYARSKQTVFEGTAFSRWLRRHRRYSNICR